MIKPLVDDVKDAAKDNEFFRRVVLTGSHLQLVLMSLRPGEHIGNEVHEVDQLLGVVRGEGEVVVDGDVKKFKKGDFAFVPAGVDHDIVNTADKPMKLFTIYAPPQHKPGLVQETKPDVGADAKVGATV